MPSKLLFLILVLISAPSLADCMQDAAGNTFCGPGPCAVDAKQQVYCAPHEGGTVKINGSGDVVCGWGQCQNGPYGGLYCAIEPGGEALRNERGEIHCVGGCEAGINQLCVSIAEEG